MKLQPYEQHIVRRLTNQKLSPKFFGPFPIIAKIGQVAYTLQLPLASRVHPTFHVSQLKCHIGKQPVQTTLSPISLDGTIIKEPTRILDQRMVNRDNHIVTEVLVEWANTFPEDSTWENLQDLQYRYLAFDRLRSLRTRILRSRES